MEDDDSTNSGNTLPPKLDLRKSGILKPATPAAGTPVAPGAIAPAPAVASAAPVAAQPVAGAPRPIIPGAQPAWKPKPVMPAAAVASVAQPQPTPKKDTSRIPLEAAKPRVEKAIPVAGMEAPSTVKISKPGDTVQITGLPKPDDVEAAEKRKTSRISLDAVLNDSTREADTSGPKTIRLKRPGEAPTVKAGAAGGDESEKGASQTQRKTIVVKRQQSTAAGQKISVARAGGGKAAADGAPSDMPVMSVPAPHGIFGFFAVAATLVLGVVVYMFAAQAIGPNSCMTQYSVWTEGPNLSWPGKILPK